MLNRASQLFTGLFLAPLLAACAPSEATSSAAPSSAAPPAELAALRAEVDRLRAENEQLRATPQGLAFEIDSALRAGNAEKADGWFRRLSDRFPTSPETADMHKRIDAFYAKRRADEEEARRIASLGFKGLPVNPAISVEDTALTLTSTAVVRRWTFDSYGDGWRFVDAEKDKKMLITRMNISSKRKEPGLFGIGAYVTDGSTLKLVGTMRYRFARWSSYGSFLGTQADFRNEFSHSWRIPFTAGVALSEQDLKHGPIYIVATREPCHERSYERFGQPPVAYLPGKCDSLKPTLSVDDFKSGPLAILKRID